MCIKKNMPQNCGGVVRPTRPILNRKKIEELLGEKFENVVMYYLDTNKLNRKTYNDSYVVGHKQMADMSNMFVQDCDNNPELTLHVPVAVFAKIYDCNYANVFADRDFIGATPPYNSDGRCIAGNVIFYNKTTRKYESMPRGWMYVGGRTCRGSASEDSMLAVFGILIKNSYKRKLIQDFLRQQNVK